MLNELYRGRVRWDLLQRFPEQDDADRLAGEAMLASLRTLLRDWIDAARVEDAGLPDGFLEALQAGGFLRLMIDPRLGGLGLSTANAFRAVELAASSSAAVAYTLAIANGFGSGSYLPVLRDGPLKEMISARVAQGIVSGGADAEAAGTANATRATVAVAVEDGAAFEITGEKVFIGNAPVADLMDVSATLIADDGTEEVRLFFVDMHAEGVQAVATHDFMGLRGAAIGALRLDAVRVPAEHLLEEPGDGWRMRPGARVSDDAPHDRAIADAPLDLARVAALGRNLVIGPTSLAIGRLCLAWSRDFVNRRSIDGRCLGEYEEIQRIVGTTAADVFTIETVASWTLHGHGRADTQPELAPAKNITSLACWRAVDRTMSLLGGEGYETAASKQRRGVRALPVERAFRDARSLRVAGGVDFMVDIWAAQSSIASCYYAAPNNDPAPAGPGSEGADDAGAPGAGEFETGALSPRCSEHARAVEDETDSLAQLCRRLTRGHTQDELFTLQRTLGIVGRIGGELLTMALVLSRAAQLAARGNSAASGLADIACTASRQRLDALWPQLADEPDYAATSAAALDGGGLDFLLGDVRADPRHPASQKESALA